MGRTCDLCGRGTTVGKNRPVKGVLRRKGGVGIKKSPQTKRTLRVNLHDKRLTVNGVTRKVRICGRCLKATELQRAQPPLHPMVRGAAPSSAAPSTSPSTDPARSA